MRSILIVTCWLLATSSALAQQEPGAAPHGSPNAPPPAAQQPPPPQPLPMPYAQGGYQQPPHGYPSAPYAQGGYQQPPHGYPSAHHPHGAIPLKDVPEFRSGKRRRLAGILVTSIGGGVSLVVTSMGLLLRTSCNLYGCHDSGDGIIVGGLIGLGASLAVGIPLWVSGQRQVNEARRCWASHLVSSLDIAPSSKGLQVSSSWRF